MRSAASARAAPRQADRHRRGQGLGRHGARRGRELARSAVGLVVTRYGYAVPCERIEIVEAAHPVPDAAGMRAAQRMLELVGGPARGRPGAVPDLRRRIGAVAVAGAGTDSRHQAGVNRALLACGATISEMNCVRRHLSAIKGGRLAAACHPAQVLTLLISDVPGDRPIDIASGPTVADPTTCADALPSATATASSLPRAGARAAGKRPRRIRETGRSAAGPRRACASSPPRKWRSRPPRRWRARRASPRTSSATPSRAKRAMWARYSPASRAQVAERDQPFAAPCVLLSGGETTVTVRGRGRGGRNVEYLAVARHRARGTPGHSRAGRRHRRRRRPGGDRRRVLGPDTLARAWPWG